jgi:hypothetical protein
MFIFSSQALVVVVFVIVTSVSSINYQLELTILVEMAS